MAGTWSPHQLTSGVIVRRSARLLVSRATDAMTVESTVVQESGQFISQNIGMSSNKDDDADTSVANDTLLRDLLQEENGEEQEPEESTKRTRRKRGKRKAEVQINEDGEEFAPQKKPRKKRSPKPEPTYIIPDVERKTTTFKGRLGVLRCIDME